jgi:ubiquinone/menaquinone biosynthesis C-methylase UbiE
VGDFYFHRGPDYAADLLGYDRAELARTPPESSASFAGVANPHRMGPLGEGATVVDIGCGAGMDLLLAAHAVGRRGRAIGVDMTEAMVERARAAARAAGLENVEVRLGDAVALPIEDASADVVISNGVLNLTPDKSAAFGEVLRALRPGGRFLYADIVVGNELSESIRKDIDLWTG